MILFVESLGFRCVDMFEPLWRQRDGILWQMDFAFIPRDRQDFAGGFL
jgi:hypothetical protein